MKRINAQGRVREYVYVAMFLLLFAALLIILYSMPQAQIIRICGTHGYYDFTQNSFAGTNYRINKGLWESWPEKLYTPDDLIDENIAGQSHLLDAEEYNTIQYATHRLRLNLPPGRIYGIRLTSSDYSMRFYINGVEIDSVGIPGETRATTVPRVQSRVYYFAAENAEAELVMQAANFVHASDGAWPPDFYIGSQENITRQNTVGIALSFVVVGYLLTGFFDHLGLFCLNRKRQTTLVFALSCLLLALMNKNLMMMFFPDYNWFIAIRFEYIVHFLTFATLTLFLDMLYPKLLNKIVTRAYYALAAAYILLTLLTDTLLFTGLLKYFEYISIALIAYILIRLSMNLKAGGIGNSLSFLGALVLSLTGINDILYHQGIYIIDPVARQFFLTPVGMTFFVFCNSMVVSAEYVDTELSLIDERRQVEALSANNAALDRVNQMKSDVITTISHESRTPLAVLASYAGLVSMELKAKGVDEQIAADLDTIAFEAKRVANLIDGMRRLSQQKEVTARRTILDIGEIIRQTTRLYEPIIERSNVKLETVVPGDLFPVCGNAEELTQVIFNLLQNAKNHTEHGNISALVKKESGTVTVTVCDTGSGIAPELLPHVFERGTTGEKGGTGLGLAICTEIIESHGGTITIASEIGKGTAVTFTLPEYMGGDKNAG